MPDYFIWDVNREIIHLYGPLGIRWYSIFIMLGFVIGYQIFTHMLKLENRPLSIRDSLLYHIVLGTIIGARLGHCLFYAPDHYLNNPLEIIKIWEGGLASHGGFLGVIISLYIFSLKNKDFSFLWLCDRITVCSIFAGGFIRIGNFFNSEIIGRVTDVPWAMIFAKVDSLPRHPSQIYESLGYLSISGILYLIYKKSDYKPLEGRILGFGFVIAFIFRIAIEQFKENQVTFESSLPMNLGQLLSIPFIILGVLLVAGLQKKFIKSA